MSKTFYFLPIAVFCLATSASGQSLQERLLQAEDARPTTEAGLAPIYEALKGNGRRTAIRAIAQDRQIMPLMGVDQRKVYLVTSAIGGGLAGLAAALMVLQYDIYPQIGLQFGPLIFMICVLGGLGNMIGGFVAAFIIAQFIAVGGSCFATEWGYAIAFLFFMVAIFIRPQGLFAAKS